MKPDAIGNDKATPVSEALPPDAQPGEAVGMAVGVAIGEAIGEAVPAGAEGPGSGDRVPIRRLVRAALQVTSTATGAFLASVGIGLLSLLLTQYTLQLFTRVTATIGSGTETGGAVAGDNATTLLERIMPADPRTAAYLFLILTVAGIALGFLETALSAWADTRMAGRLQQRLHDRLIQLGPSYHEKHDISETTAIVTRYSVGSQMVLRDVIAFPVTQTIALASALFFLIGNLQQIRDASIWIQIAVASPLVLVPAIAWKFAGGVGEASRVVRDEELALAAEFTNSAQMPLEVQLMGAQAQRNAVFASRLERLLSARIRATLSRELQTQAQRSVPSLLQAGFLIYAVVVSVVTGAGREEAAGILGIFLFVPQVLGPVEQLVVFLTGLGATWPQVEKVVEILEATPEIDDRPGARPLTIKEGELECEGVTFAYAEGARLVLNNLSFRFPDGRITAIVARSGAGKSTLLNLATRVREPQSGALKIDGQNIADVTLASLREQVAKVSQFPLFLQDTVRANLTLGAPHATDAELKAACERTGIWPVLQNAVGPGVNPLDYVVPRGVGEGLSGGQRRILAFTRALVRKPAILLLDEPSTGVDAIGRGEIADVVRQVTGSMTVLVVDHDMDFVARLADVVCCLEDGTFTDTGSPHELLSRNTLFRRLTTASQQAETLAATANAQPDTPADSRHHGA